MSPKKENWEKALEYWHLLRSDNDAEFDKVYWEQTGPALKKLTYQGEKDVLEEAIKLAKSF